MMIEIKKVGQSDREWIKTIFKTHWGSEIVVSRGKVHTYSDVDGYVAFSGLSKAGLITYKIDQDACEIVTVNSFVESRGIGSKLVEKVKSTAEKSGCRRIWLVTTNDNINAIRFWQRRGFSLVSVHRNAIHESRKIKPEIPESGENGIPIRDEIELEMVLA